MYRRPRRRASDTWSRCRATPPDAPVYAPPSVRNPFASTLWRNQAFVRVWSAATISIFGSLVTRIALPLAAILILGSGAVEVALLRSMELIATLVFGLVAGRLGRPPAATSGPDLGGPRTGRAARLDPGRLRVRRPGVLAAARRLGARGDPDDLLRLGRQRLPADRSSSASSWSRPTARWRPAGRPPSSRPSGSAASSSSGSPHRSPSRSTRSATWCRPILLATIRREEAPPPPREDREPVLAEIRDGLRIVRHDPVLRAFVGRADVARRAVGDLRRDLVPVRAR